MISCSEAVTQLWHYLEHELSPEERGTVEEHLAFCRRCCGELEFADELRGFLERASSPELPADVEDRLTSFLRNIDDEAGETEEEPA